MTTTTDTNNVPTTTVKKESSLVDSTLQRIVDMQAAGELQLPKNYSAANAVRSAWLILQDVKDSDKKPVLQVCSKESIAYALLSMVVQGLNPSKHQCSFIAYGGKLVLQREYQGTIAMARRAGMKNVFANAIFDGDKFQYEVDIETGRKKLTNHAPSFDNLGGEVKGAYAIVEMEDGSRFLEIMNMPMIRKSWEMGATKGNSPAHKNFPDQMACKTVIGRALKTLINSSDDAWLFEEEEPTDSPLTADVKHEIATHANGGAIGFEESGEIVENNFETNQTDGATVLEPQPIVSEPIKTKVPF